MMTTASTTVLQPLEHNLAESVAEMMKMFTKIPQEKNILFAWQQSASFSSCPMLLSFTVAVSNNINYLSFV